MVLLFVLGVALVILAIMLVASALSTTSETGVTRSLAVLEAMTNAPNELTKDLDRSFADRVLEPLQQRALGLGRRLSGADTPERIRRKLDLAGNPHGWTVDRVVSGKVIGAVAGLVFGIVFGLMFQGVGMRLLLAVGGLVVGFFGPNLLARDFRANAPNERWAGDIVGIWTAEGWLYVAALLDTYSRFIAGWAMSVYRDEALVAEALRMALARRDLPETAALIQHTDRGSQYSANDYLALLKQHGIQVSMNGKSDPYDNAMMESFWSSMQIELLNRRRWKTRVELANAIFEYIEIFYNRQRRHSSLGYRTPIEFEITSENDTASAVS